MMQIVQKEMVILANYTVTEVRLNILVLMVPVVLEV